VGWQEKYYSRFYYNKAGYVGGTEEFFGLCERYVPHGSRILEIGAGPSNRTSRFLATIGEVHGLDPDPDVRTNEALKSATVLQGSQFPLADGSFDSCVSDYVVEHVENGAEHLKNVERVLVPGGVYVFRTVNRRHYVGLLASVTPHRFHKLVANRARRLPAGAHEPYPTTYAMNTKSAIRKAAAAARLEIESIRLVEKEPSYGRFSRVAFLSMMAYERLVNAHNAFANFRANLFVVLRKPLNEVSKGMHAGGPGAQSR
jgi:SAM-dependent methyltransferase